MRRLGDISGTVRQPAGGPVYLLCRYCKTAFSEEEVLLENDEFELGLTALQRGANPLGLVMFLGTEAACPNCRLPLRVILWDKVRESHPDYPEIPEPGMVYRSRAAA